ncbi:hypothetical protein BX600DRAFT_440774 [Xylariales sp. PMI_506]|nr:hypothetical protein BX600DRAFT_440774 [Xylariales sp. PMI_506]
MAATLTKSQKNILAMNKGQYLAHIGNTIADFEANGGGADLRSYHLHVAAAVFRADGIDSSRPSILLLKRRSPPGSGSGLGTNAAAATAPHGKQYRRAGGNGSGGGGSVGAATVFEIPTGPVYDSDLFVSDAIARAVERQASLKVTRVLGMLHEHQWTEMRRAPRHSDGHDSEAAAAAAARVHFDDLDSDEGDDNDDDEEDDSDYEYYGVNGNGNGHGSRSSMGGGEHGLRRHVQLSWAVWVDNVDSVLLKSKEHEEYVWANASSIKALNLRDDVRELAKEALTWASTCLFSGSVVDTVQGGSNKRSHRRLGIWE